MGEEQQHRLALPKGTRIRDFEFHRVLGHGGFGITYLGWNITLDIPVAIKEYFPADLATRERNLSVVPQTDQAAPDFQWGLERFLDEARILARFQHPGIVRIHHFFEAHRTAYIAMDYVEGESLSAYLTRKGTLSEIELQGILDPLLSALEVVHRADFLHRDIKPGNIVLRAKDGSPVLLDFGAARQAMGAKSRSVTSIVTPGYAPIEQYSTRAAQGAWTDIYALGGVCYRALTGENPFDATDRMRNDPLIPVAQRCAGKASPKFLAAIDAALTVDAPDRPQSIAAWRESLGEARKARNDGANDAAVAGKMEQGASPSKPRKNLKYKLVAAVLGLAALLIGGERFVEHAEQVELEKKRQEQAALVKQAQEQAALEKERQDQAALEKQEQEKAALEKQRGKQAALKKKRQEQAELEKQAQEQAAQEKQRQDQAALEKQQRDQAALEKQQREKKAALEKQRQDQAALEKQRQEQAFVAEVGRPPHPGGMNNGDTDLHVAARLNLPLLTASLLEQGADVHATNKDGWTPLHVAAKEDAAATAGVLLKQKADVNARETLFGWTPLHLAAAKEDASATAEVLLQQKADVNVKDKFGWTPLHSAASNNAYKTAEVLLNSGADVNAKDNHGWGPLYWASRKKASQAADVLRRYGGRE